MLVENGLETGTQKGLSREDQQFVGPIAERNLRRVDTQLLGQALLQAIALAIRIQRKAGQRAIDGGQRASRRTQRIFV